MQFPAIRLGLVLSYWLTCTYLILEARGDPDVFAWIIAIPFTMPVSFACLLIEVRTEWERAWLTLNAVAGAMFNGLLFLWLYRWLVRRLTLKSSSSS